MGREAILYVAGSCHLDKPYRALALVPLAIVFAINGKSNYNFKNLLGTQCTGETPAKGAHIQKVQMEVGAQMREGRMAVVREWKRRRYIPRYVSLPSAVRRRRGAHGNALPSL